MTGGGGSKLALWSAPYRSKKNETAHCAGAYSTNAWVGVLETEERRREKTFGGRNVEVEKDQRQMQTKKN